MALLRALLRNQFSQGGDGAQHRPGFFIAGFDHDAVFLLQAQHQFQRIDGIQPEAFVAKQRRIDVDIVGRHVLEIHGFDDELLQFLVQVGHVVVFLGSGRRF